MDIVIYMNEEDFKHKIGCKSAIDDKEGTIYAFWSMSKIPRKFTEDDKIFLATRKHIMGYIECEEFYPEDINGEAIVWISDTFTYIHSIPCKPFRGFRYRWFEYQIEREKQQLEMKKPCKPKKEAR